VDVVTTEATMRTEREGAAHAMNGGDPTEWTLQSPPPDVVQPVVVAMAADAAADEWVLETPPPDVRQDVVVDARAGAAARAAAVDAPTTAAAPEYDERIDDAPDPEEDEADASDGALDNQEIYRIIREVASAHSGDLLYAAVDPELRAAEQERAPLGIGVGFVLFPQGSGRLGAVLRLMSGRDPVAFAEIFGPAAQELLSATNAADAAGRLRAVAGEPLSSPAWMERFRRAGQVPAFQAAQNEAAIEGQFRPMLRIAFELGCTTDRTLAMAYEYVVRHGLGGGVRSLVRAAGPLRTANQRAHALRTLGFDDVEQFQASTGWTPRDGRFGPVTHAALVGALRRQGAATVPTAIDIVGRLVAAAATPASRQRLVRLRDSAALADIVYALD
jgi:hypothetical protein